MQEVHFELCWKRGVIMLSVLQIEVREAVKEGVVPRHIDPHTVVTVVIQIKVREE